MEALSLPNLTVRGGVYYVKKKVRGRVFVLSLGKRVGEAHKDVVRCYNDVLARIDDTTDDTTIRVPTFGTWWQTYAKTQSAHHADPQRDVVIVGHVLPLWGTLPMNEITKSMCELHLARRRAQVSEGTVNRDRATLQAIFERFLEEQSSVPVRRRVVMTNPFAFIRRVKTAVKDRVLLPEEEVLLRAVLTPALGRWLTFMLGTGLRIEEACHFQPMDYNSVTRLLKVRPEAAKGGKAREVPLFDDGLVEQAIREQLEQEGELWNRPQQWYRETLLEQTRYRDPRRQLAREQGVHTPKRRRLVWADIPHLSPHALRHTFGTRFLQRGGDIFVLSKILGHSSVKVTETHYVHLLKEDLVSRSRHLVLHGAV